jgi:hypothetical protein
MSSRPKKQNQTNNRTNYLSDIDNEDFQDTDNKLGIVGEVQQRVCNFILFLNDRSRQIIYIGQSIYQRDESIIHLAKAP